MKVAELTILWFAAQNQLKGRGHTPQDWLDDLNQIAPQTQPANVMHGLEITPVDDDWLEAELVVWDEANHWVEAVVLRNTATSLRPLEHWAAESLTILRRRHTKHVAALVDYRVQLADDTRFSTIEDAYFGGDDAEM